MMHTSNYNSSKIAEFRSFSQIGGMIELRDFEIEQYLRGILSITVSVFQIPLLFYALK